MKNLPDTLVEAAREGNLGLMLDLDGATTGINPPGIHHPVKPDHELARLVRIFSDSGNAVAINTGRPALFVNGLLPNVFNYNSNPNMFSATENGALITNHRGKAVGQHQLKNLQGIRSQLKQEIAGFKGAILEDHKMNTITLSLARADDKKAAYEHMLRCSNQIATPKSGIDIVSVIKDNDAYIELIPAGINKATATEFILDQGIFHGRHVVCIGDSAADEGMMAAVNDSAGPHESGFTVGVGSTAPTIATIRVDTIDEARAMLRFLADAAREGAAQRSKPQMALAPR